MPPCRVQFGDHRGLHPLDVDADLDTSPDRVERHAVGVRHVEPQRVPPGGAELGLARRRANELDLGGRAVEVAAENQTKPGPRHDEASAIGGEDESVTALRFIDRQDRFQLARLRTENRVEACSPHVCFGVGQCGREGTGRPLHPHHWACDRQAVRPTVSD